MSFGQNLQCLRKMRNRMTQEELAEKLGVSRQTISKWELDRVYPEVFYQDAQKYVAITIKDPTVEPFRLIPNAYKALMTYMQMNGLSQKNDKQIISCFEKEYLLDGVSYMDVYIAIK